MFKTARLNKKNNTMTDKINPSKTFVFIIFLFITLLLNSKAFASSYSPCPSVILTSPHQIKFTENEKILVCGDPKSDSWREIPPFQARYFAKVFLQQRGYQNPVFKEKNDVLFIETGPLSRIKKIEITGQPPRGFKISHGIKTDYGLMTPAVINTIENKATTWLTTRGYACPQLETEAFSATETLHLKINSGTKKPFLKIEQQKIPGLRDNILRRYDAFSMKKPYNSQWLELTTQRIESNGIVQHTHFTTECQDNEVVVKQQITPGAPRLFTIGFGANTEQLVIAKSSWRHARLGQNASSLQFSLFASYIKQEFETEAHWYFLPYVSRWHLKPTLTVTRRDEKNFEYVSFDAALLPAVTWDGQYFGISLAFGPNLNFTRTFEGAAQETTHFLSTVFKAELTSHGYEYHALDPLTGYTLRFLGELNHASLFSDVTAHKFSLTGQALYNVADLDPPFLTVGFRGGLYLTATDRDASTFGRLPPEFLYYLGGSPNLRGFGRSEIANAGQGALTAFFSSIEVRFRNILPLDVQPIFFTDLGMLGSRSASLDKTLYWSPGLGLRWSSIIGVFRATAAHGFSVGNNNSNQPSHWQLYLSFGEEF
ncbi:MAG: BamA/TamA family outer membrane protein [bacterium]